MNRRSIVTLILLVLLFPLTQPALGQAAANDPFANALNARMPGWLAKYRVPGAVITYIQNGAVVWTQAFGLADTSTGAVMKPEMIFNFGSCGKVLTGWGVMRLVEQGKVDLDAPVNRYLKRWQIHSGPFDAQQVTPRRLLSHTAGLTVSGFSDYSQRRSLPTLVEMLEGQNQTDGRVILFQEPGTSPQYSGGGFVLLQMMIEDVSGMPFAQFMEQEVTAPLGLPSLKWTWTPELTAMAPTPYGPGGEALDYRQLASQAIGSEIGTVPDFARFIAAAASGPANEPPGRGVLRADTITQMTALQPGSRNEGLAYGVGPAPNGRLLQHFGNNPGWSAFFSLDTGRGEGLVMATNSSNGFPLNAAVQNLWTGVMRGQGEGTQEPSPDPQTLPLQGMIMLGLAGLLGLGLLVGLVVFLRQVRAGKRAWVGRPDSRGLLGTGIWGIVTLFWVYWFYTSLPLPFPPAFPDFWHTPQVDLVMVALLAWTVFNLVKAWFLRNRNEPREVNSN